MPAELFLEKAKEYLGTPFHHQGRLKGTGVDCAGLLVCAAKEAGYKNVPDIKGYKRSPDGETLQRILDNYLDPIGGVENACLGDIVLFQFHGSRPQHLGIISNIAPFRIIHAYSIPQKVIEHTLDTMWLNRVAGLYRLRK